MRPLLMGAAASCLGHASGRCFGGRSPTEASPALSPRPPPGLPDGWLHVELLEDGAHVAGGAAVEQPREVAAAGERQRDRASNITRYSATRRAAGRLAAQLKRTSVVALHQLETDSRLPLPLPLPPRSTR